MITVVDAPCGAGKTSWAIEHINGAGVGERFLFITPFLSECDRVVKSCSGFYQPSSRSGRGKKLNNLIDLVKGNKNIVTTHSLFSSVDDEFIAAIKDKNYTLIIDEALNVLNEVNLYEDDVSGNKKTTADINTLIEKEIIKTDSDGKISWDENYSLGKYNYVEANARHNNLFLAGNYLVMWMFHQELFSEELFKNIYIMTYQFQYQMQSYYFKFYDIKYNIYGVERRGEKYELTAELNDSEFRAGARKLITICDDEKMNYLGTVSLDNPKARTALSLRWYSTNTEQCDKLHKNIVNFWKNKARCSANEFMWGTFKDYYPKIKGREVSAKNFVAINARATNDYANKTCLCYLSNRYLNPNFVRFFAKRKVKVDQDGFALSELIQWIWRSAIRNGEKIYLYIPSERMRNLLKSWMEGKY